MKTTTAIKTSTMLKSRGIYKIKLINAQTIQKRLCKKSTLFSLPTSTDLYFFSVLENSSANNSNISIYYINPTLVFHTYGLI